MRRIKVRKLMEKIMNRGIKTFEGETVEELILHFADNPNTRIAVMQDKNGVFKGFTTIRAVGSVAFPLMAGIDEIGYDFFVRMVSRKVEDIITYTNLYVSPEETLDRAVERMLNYNLDELPVVENKRCLGIITMADVLEVWVDKEAMTGGMIE